MSNQICEIRIELKFNPSISVISGRPTGLECYINQMKNIVEANINTEGIKFIIIFPECIKLVSGSCLLGMFEEINNMIGIEGIKEKFVFEGNIGDELKKMLLDELKRSGC